MNELGGDGFVVKGGETRESFDKRGAKEVSGGEGRVNKTGMRELK
jgi:hypothetical protein